MVAGQLDRAHVQRRQERARERYLGHVGGLSIEGIDGHKFGFFAFYSAKVVFELWKQAGGRGERHGAGKFRSRLIGPTRLELQRGKAKSWNIFDF